LGQLRPIVIRIPPESAGADVPPAPDPRVIHLLAQFADLGAPEQASFLDTLNVYLYTSPQRRRTLRLGWARGLAALHGEDGIACGCGEEPRGR